MELVSIVITTYNRRDLVQQAINSVLKQTYANTQVVVVDDGSVDDTPEVLAGYGDKITVVRTENQGCPAALNNGIAAAKGDLITFLDSDDMFMPHAVERQMSMPIGDDVRFCKQRFSIVDGNDDELIEKAAEVNWPDTGEDWVVKDPLVALCSGRFLQIDGMIARRETISRVGPFHRDLPAGNDYEWFFRAATKTQLTLNPEVLIERRYHGSQTGLHTEKSLRSMILATQRMNENAAACGDDRAARAAKRSIATRLSHLSNVRAQSGARGEAANLAFQAFLHDYARPARLAKSVKFLVVG